MGRPVLTPEERFWSHVDKNGPVVRAELGRCWIWTGARLNKKGYGAFALKWSRPTSAHRASWELAHGTVPDGMWVLHRCDVRSCVNPAHLFLGTHVDNMRDMKEKGRGRAPIRLSDDQIAEIRAMRASGTKCVQIAARFNTTPSYVSQICRGCSRARLGASGRVFTSIG